MHSRFSLTLLLAALAVAGCQRTSPAEREAALETVRRNVRLLDEGKIDAMMETIHPQSPAFAETRTVLEELLKKAKLKCELTQLAIVGTKPDEVRVRFEQITEKLGGEGELAKTAVAGVHLLRKDGALWKIFDTKITRTDVLEAPAEISQNP